MISEQVLYRKWRPGIFGDIVGQEHIRHTLQRSVATNRVAHAYLFTGPRGVGKTSSARILAKALNCTNSSNGEPDNTCQNCIAINGGYFIDLIEIDAASNRSIDNIRDLRDSARLHPTAAKLKVYIIDEVHMLTEHAFNALLKTLEEPPPHVVMILATTDVHKVPATIVSRCQCFAFKRLTNEDIFSSLTKISQAEKFDCEPEALMALARASWGSLRDAENLLEQLIVSVGTVPSETGTNTGSITRSHAHALLGFTDTESSLNLAKYLLAGDMRSSLEIINREAEKGTNLQSLRNGTIDAIRSALLIKSGITDALGQNEEMVAVMQEASAGTSMQQLLKILTAFGEINIRGNSSSPLILELAVLRALTEQTAPSDATAQPTSTPVHNQNQPMTTPQTSGSLQTSVLPADDDRWRKVLEILKSQSDDSRISMRKLLTNVTPPTPKDNVLLLRFRQRSLRDAFTDSMKNETAKERLRQAIEDAYGEPLHIRVSSPTEAPQASSAKKEEDSPLIKFIRGMGGMPIDNQQNYK